MKRLFQDRSNRTAFRDDEREILLPGIISAWTKYRHHSGAYGPDSVDKALDDSYTFVALLCPIVVNSRDPDIAWAVVPGYGAPVLPRGKL